MTNMRLPTKKEKRQLVEYVMNMNGMPFLIADYEVATWFVAVTDMHRICGNKGWTMIVVTPDGTTHLFKWNEQGRLSPLMGVYVSRYQPSWETDEAVVTQEELPRPY